ncbi:MAG: hypothetical protein K9J37_08685 [Saprospiraceae bacterium]|nr:hypothetical protein [Saprospiraceae bacterium]MCF8249976.1 hypothetical protein [Saprospiraceae bacterium]MCF8278984.1 hypothetical protein [Bacteroidales bacterium]MCF8310989.1 hypothetical protein [Saprospiraceae bacterium]MCF8439675.1 hypothetical protein [Saprospiraceae bacterium]
MSNQVLIAKQPSFKRSEDYYFLRRKGIEFIEQMGSLNWTDYNAHDPGITILEVLCYAITDLGFRTGWDIKDLLACPPETSCNPDLQAFFTARNVLTTNPLTVNDYRRLLVDLEPIRNAWLVCRSCACETGLYGDCKESKLVYHHPAGQDKVVKVTPRGTYDVMLELENDPKLGDLNNRKIRHQFTLKIGDDNRRYPVVAEVRFPDLGTDFWSKVLVETKVDDEWTVVPRKVNAVLMQRLSLNTEGIDATDVQLRNWQNLFYTTLRVKLDSGEFVFIENATVRLFGKSAVREVFEKEWLEQQLEIAAETGIVALFFEKMAKVQEAILLTKDSLHAHRNLAEDFCCVGRVCVQDVAVCADIEVSPDADIDKVQSQVLFEIENYFNPGVKFYSLRELLEEKTPVEEIFEGPQMSHGFLKTADLEAAQLKRQLRTSDIINQLVEIEGVVAVKDLMLTRYDDLGNQVTGVADVERGNPNQLSARWTLEISDRCQPRLYVENSKFLFIKNGLPFLAREEEVHHTLQQLRGESERLKIKNNPTEDLAVPQGKFRDPESYYPVQYSFPITYGIGYEGLRAGAPAERQAQAKQLKAFLLFFEQLLGNQLAQVANTKSLFSLDPTVERTYFTKNLRSENLIRGSEELIDSDLDDARLQQLAESEPEYLDRRNRFLDHLLSRFAEDFTDFALTQFSVAQDRQQAQRDLISTKINFLKNYPNDSRNRARALDYRATISSENHAVLRRRIARLLGLDETTEQQIFIIEHLLLRPRFPGDAVMPVCLDPTCQTCHDVGPYSFQMTVVMPGWARLSDDDLYWRRYADRTIEMEAPAHILTKICWVGDEQLEFDPCSTGLKPVVETICLKGLSATNEKPTPVEIEQALEVAWAAFKAKFDEWMVGKEQEFFELNSTEAELETFFENNDPFVDISDPVISNWAALRVEIIGEMASYFATVAVEGLQYTRLKAAWEDWLSIAATDWCADMPLKSGLEQLLVGTEAKKVFEKEKGRALKSAEVAAAKNCACELLETFGQAYHERVTSKLGTPTDQQEWDLAKIIKGIFDEIFITKKFNCPGLHKLLAKEKLEIVALFTKNYPNDLVETSRKLKRLIGLLSNVKSIYPPATLHDCDVGNDDNPVRLGSTALGASF